MLIEIVIFLLLGTLTGIFTGLIPGIHINLVGSFIITFSTLALSKILPIYFVTFIVAMAITHTFLDFIPSIFLGCPDTDTELSVLPGHDLLKKGKGHEAVILSNYGSLFAIFALILISIHSVILISKTYNFFKELIPYILLAVSTFMVFSEKKKIKAFTVFFLTGSLGYIILNLQNINQPLLPLLTGLFGSSMLILTIKNKTKIPAQKITKPKIKSIKPLLGAVIASPICSFLPGLGSGQAAIIGNTISKTNKKGFIMLLGATNTLVMGFSFLSLYTISKTRTGAALAIQEIIGTPTTNIIIFIITLTIIVGIFAFFITTKISKLFAKNINKISYTTASFITIIVLSIIVILVSGILGFIILIISTFTGIYCISLGVKRTNMMGCLLLPTILLYFL